MASNKYPNRYLLYRTVASDSEPVGYVVNTFTWSGEGQSLPVPDGMSVVADAAGEFPVGGIYSANVTEVPKANG